MATATKFTIIKGKSLDFYIIIKENGTTMPLELDDFDTFTFSLVDKKTNQKYIDSKPMIISDALNGEVQGTILDTESVNLPVKRSGAEDGYMARPNLRVVISGNTALQGDMAAIIENVTVING